MRRAQVEALPLGIYRVWWKGTLHGYSLAAMGMLPSGQRWLAPTNWVRPSETNWWVLVDAMELVH